MNTRVIVSARPVKGSHATRRFTTDRQAGLDHNQNQDNKGVAVDLDNLRVHEFTTLDGIIDNPTWTAEYGFDPKMGGAIGGIMGGCTAILLGRTTYEMFAPAWSARTAAEDPGAPFMNDTPKYVVSSTLQHADWRNSSILGAYSATAVRELKTRTDGPIYVSGSGTLVRSLLTDGLVDELELFVYPLALGSGPRLFPEGGPSIGFGLVGCEAYDNGVLHLTYTPAAKPE